MRAATRERMISIMALVLVISIGFLVALPQKASLPQKSSVCLKNPVRVSIITVLRTRYPGSSFFVGKEKL